MTYAIATPDVQEAAEVLRTFLAEVRPDLDFSPGGQLDELITDSHAPIFALFRTQLAELRQRRSLLTLAGLPDDADTRDAVDAILANVFFIRAQGRRARGVVTLHLTQPVDTLVPRATRFFRTASTPFQLDATADLVIAADAWRPNPDASGALVDYIYTVNVVATNPGTAFNAPPGRFVAVDRFSPFLLYVDHAASLEFGLDADTNPAAIGAATEAMSARVLVNARSNAVTLATQFQPTLERTTTLGYGDPEMVRDVSREVVGAGIHLGGCMDLYARLPLIEVTERLVVGARTARPDRAVIYFRDSGADFVAAGVVAGDVVYVRDGLPESPFQFRIASVDTTELVLIAGVPASRATDEASPAEALTYSVGSRGPEFDDKVALTGPTTTAVTSRSLATPNAVMLTGRPVYRITNVELVAPPSTLDAYRDAAGRVRFTVRRNAALVAVPAPRSALGYRVRCLNPGAAQSVRATTLVDVGWTGLDLDGYDLDVTYTSLGSFETVDAYVADPLNRPGCADTLVRGAHPVFLSLTLPYRLRTRQSDPFGVASASSAVAAVINDFADDVVLDVSFVLAELRRLYPQVEAFYATTIYYELYAPDGDVYRYATEDRVTLTPAASGTSARLLNPTEVGLPATGYHARLAHDLRTLGLTDRNVRYMTATDAVRFARRST